MFLQCFDGEAGHNFFLRRVEAWRDVGTVLPTSILRLSLALRRGHVLGWLRLAEEQFYQMDTLFFLIAIALHPGLQSWRSGMISVSYLGGLKYQYFLSMYLWNNHMYNLMGQNSRTGSCQIATSMRQPTKQEAFSGCSHSKS